MTATAHPVKDLLLAYHMRLWRDGDATAIDDYWAGDATATIAGFEATDVGAMKADHARYFAAFDDIDAEVLDLLAEADRVVLRWRTSGNHIGTYGVVPATGRRVAMTGIDIYSLREGLIVDCVSLWDGLDVFDQLGVLPPLY